MLNIEPIGPALVLAAALAAAAAALRLRRPAVAGIAAITFALALVPLGSVSAAGYALAFPGPLSAATLLLAAGVLLRALGSESRPSNVFLAGVLVCGLLLYPTAAGFIAIDLYDLGFRGVTVPALMAVCIAVGWIAGAADVAIWIGVAALLYLGGAYSSVNLWDCLIDPVAVLAALAILAARHAARPWRAVHARAKRANSRTTRS